MYFDLLAPGNREFEELVARGAGHHKGSRLKDVLAAVEAAQKVPSAPTLTALLNALNAWRLGDPKEYAARGNNQGAAYRLWMEARQALRNRYAAPAPFADPPQPGNLPGSVVSGVYVPEGEGHMEICHGFAYRWAIAAGKIQENPALPARRGTSFNGPNAEPVLYPGGYAQLQPARANGAMRVQPGDIVAMYVVPGGGHPNSLGHSLIAETPTRWFSANNAGTFGVGTGRSSIDTTGAFGVFNGQAVGWIGNGNQWRRPDGVAVHVVYRRI